MRMERVPMVADLFAAVLVAAALAAAGPAGGAQGANGPDPPLRTLTTARAVHNLPVDQAAHAYPVHLHAVVTYYDPYIDARHGALFACDRSGCVFISVPARPILPIRAGDAIDVAGVTGPGDYAPIVASRQIQFEAHSRLPENPPRVALSRLLTGVFDCQWVEVEGRVRNVHLEPHNVILEVAAEGGTLTAISVRQPNANYDALIDSLVRIRANAAPLFNQSRQMVGVHAFFPSLRELSVIQAAPPDPFAVPAVPISQLFRFSAVPELLHRAHVRGTVTLNWPGRILCIQDGKDGLCIQTTQATGVDLGSLVDVVGFPAINLFKPTLEDASFRVIGHSSASSPRSITPEEALKGNLDGQVVRVDAELIGQDSAANDPTLILRAGGLLFPATLPKDAIRSASPWKEGSILRITGVCSVQVDPLGTSLGEGAVRPQSVVILLRSADDITVLHAPSWWTPRHALEGFALVGLVVLIAFAWIVVLRHRVELQTVALRGSEERLRHLSEHDALTGLPNRLLLNDRLQTVFKRAERFQTCLGLLMVDLDEFKDVNDAFGHQAGDKLLCELARRLSSCVRVTDTVARIGGDELIVLLPDLRVAAEAEMIAAKIVAVASNPVLIERKQVAITVSVGVATYPQVGPDAEALMRCADEAMYSAKQKGKNRLQVYKPKTAERGGGVSEQILRQAPASTSGA
ncbi:MAG: GGDEF domain-containing protein [Terracidiphilus sp.]